MRRLPALPVLGVVVGFASVLMAVALFYYAFTLRRDFPDLNAPATRADAYWPQVEHAMVIFSAVGASLVGCPTFVLSALRFLRG